MTESDKIDVERALKEIAETLGISVESMPDEIKKSIAFICTSDEPR